MRIKKTFAAGAGLAFILDVVAPDRSHLNRAAERRFGARAYVSLKMKNRDANPLVGARYEMFWCDVVDRALGIAFPGQVNRIDEALWVVRRGEVDSPVRLIQGLEMFSRVFRIAISGFANEDSEAGFDLISGELAADVDFEARNEASTA